MSTLAATAVILGLLLGLLGALFPGFPGAVVAWLGVLAAAALDAFDVIPGEAVAVAALLAGLGAAGQAIAPAWGVRAVSAAGGAASGALWLGAVAVLLGAPWMGFPLALGGAAVGAVVGGGKLRSRLAVPIGCLPAAMLAIAMDTFAVLGVAAVVSVSGVRAG